MRKRILKKGSYILLITFIFNAEAHVEAVDSASGVERSSGFSDDTLRKLIDRAGHHRQMTGAWENAHVYGLTQHQLGQYLLPEYDIVQLRELLGDITYDVLFHRVLEGSTARSVDSDAELRKQLADLKWLWTEGERERSRRKAVNLNQFMMHELYIYARVVDRLKKYEIAVDEMVLLEQFIKRYEAGLKADLVRLNRQNARSYTQEQLRELIEGRYPAELFYWMTPERQQRVLQTLVELQRDIDDAQNNRSQDDDLVKQGEGSL